MNVWVVTVNGRVNSVWSEQALVEGHEERLKEVNGDQLGVKVQLVEVRES